MTNIWADTYKQIREPFFQIEDPYTVSEEKKEKEEKGEKKHKEGPAEEKAEEKKGEKEDDKPKRWWDDDGDGKGYEKGEVSGKFPKKKVKEERDLYSKNDKNEKLDVRKGIKNKVEINPKITEELEAWIDELLDEGYDLSKFTLDEIVDIYESAEVEQLDEASDTYSMPARGDAQAQKVDPMAAAKAKAARAKVSKEIADLQVAKQAQRTKVSTTESVITYLAGRTPFYEAMYDPKKTKMRPASERSKNQMTDAQRKAAKKKQERVTQIHDEGEKVLTGMTAKPRSSVPMGTERPQKPKAPEANRKLGKGKEDTLASKADKVLKSLKK